MPGQMAIHLDSPAGDGNGGGQREGRRDGPGQPVVADDGEARPGQALLERFEQGPEGGAAGRRLGARPTASQEPE